MKKNWDPIFGEIDDEEEDIVIGAEINPTLKAGTIVKLKSGVKLLVVGSRSFETKKAEPGRLYRVMRKPTGQWVRVAAIHYIGGRTSLGADYYISPSDIQEVVSGQNPTLKIPVKSKKQWGHLFKAQSQLSKAGVTFDSGTSFKDGTPKTRHWELDWSLKGAKISNPTHYLKTMASQYGGTYTRKRTPEGLIMHTLDLPKGTLRKIKQSNPIWPMIGEYFIAGLGLGAGFKTIEWGMRKVKGGKK